MASWRQGCDEDISAPPESLSQAPWHLPHLVLHAVPCAACWSLSQAFHDPIPLSSIFRGLCCSCEPGKVTPMLRTLNKTLPLQGGNCAAQCLRFCPAFLVSPGQQLVSTVRGKQVLRPAHHHVCHPSPLCSIWHILSFLLAVAVSEGALWIGGAHGDKACCKRLHTCWAEDAAVL